MIKCLFTRVRSGRTVKYLAGGPYIMTESQIYIILRYLLDIFSSSLLIINMFPKNTRFERTPYTYMWHSSPG